MKRVRLIKIQNRLCEMFIDPNVKRKDEIIKDKLTLRDGVPVFSIVEFNLLAACNRRCSFCPVGQGFYEKKGLKGSLKFDLYKKFISDLKEIDYKGKLLFSGYSEPLLYKELPNLIEYTKKEIPDIHIEAISNGDLLTADLLKDFVEKGLSVLTLSLYDGPEQLTVFENMVQESGISDGVVRFRRRYYEDGNYGLTLSNRGGLIDTSEYDDEYSQEALPLKQPCYYPFYMLKIDFNGDMLICSHDWQKNYIIGNINEQSVWELWTSEKFRNIRRSLLKGDRDTDSCRKCDVQGLLMGRESFEAWEKFEESDK